MRISPSVPWVSLGVVYVNKGSKLFGRAVINTDFLIDFDEGNNSYSTQLLQIRKSKISIIMYWKFFTTYDFYSLMIYLFLMYNLKS